MILARRAVLMVPQEGFEPPTHALRMRCSTPELLRLCSLFVGLACSWPVGDQPYQAVQRVDSPGKAGGPEE